MRILFYGPFLWHFVVRMANIARREFGIECDVLTIGRRNSSNYKRLGSFGTVADLAGNLRRDVPGLEEAERAIEDFERRTAVRASLLLGMDRYLSKEPFDVQLRFFAHHMIAVKKMLDRSYDMVIVEFNDLTSLLFHYLGRRRGVPALMVKPSRLPNHVFITNGPYQHHEDVRKNWQARRNVALPEGRRAEVEAIVGSIVGERFQIFGGGKKAKGPVQDLAMASTTFLQSCAYWPVESRRNYRYQGLWTVIAGRTVRPMRRLLARRFAGFEQPRESERYCYYALHHDPDLATLVYAPYWKDQLDLIRNISYSLPAGLKLYVKEHPVSVGYRPHGFYGTIRSHANVRLIDPRVNTFDLLSRAELVFTITGTAGWEAILVQKPVIAFGDTFWNTFDLVKQVRAPDDLPQAVDDILANWESDWDRTLRFVAAYKETLKPGDMTRFQSFYWPEEEDTARTIFHSLLEFFSEEKGRRTAPDID